MKQPNLEEGCAPLLDDADLVAIVGSSTKKAEDGWMLLSTLQEVIFSTDKGHAAVAIDGEEEWHPSQMLREGGYHLQC